MKAQLQSIVVILVATGIGFALAHIVSPGSLSLLGQPLLPMLALLAFGVQWLVFLPSYWAQTEHYYDLTGSATYISVIALAAGMRLSAEADWRTALLLGLVLIWALRLGSFLFKRIRQDGKDGRFDDIKPHFLRFLVAWTLQGLWVFLTLFAALIAMSVQPTQAPGLLEVLGLGVWLLGFAFEAVADWQKSAFKANPANKGRFIDVGLWRWSRHPNYFGEITLWVGVAMIATPVMSGWLWLGWLSPVFVAFLLIKVSGIPMLEQRADDRWGGQADYETYKARTPVLIPRPPRAQPLLS